METNYRISPFVELGRRLARQLAGGELDAVVARAIAENGWFTRQSVAQAIEAICTDLLDETVLRDWLAPNPRPDASDRARNAGRSAGRGYAAGRPDRDRKRFDPELFREALPGNAVAVAR